MLFSFRWGQVIKLNNGKLFTSNNHKPKFASLLYADSVEDKLLILLF